MRDFARMAALIEPVARTFLERGAFATLQRWFEHLPRQIFSTRPQLCLVYAWLLFSNGHHEQVKGLMQMLEVSIQQEDQRRLETQEGSKQEAQSGVEEDVRSELMMLSALMALKDNDLARAIDLSHTILHGSSRLPIAVRHLARLNVQLALGRAYLAQGEIDAAEQVLVEAHSAPLTGEYQILNLIVLADLAELYELRGRLHTIARLYRQALHLVISHEERSSPFTEWLSLGLSRVLCEWNQLDEAERYAQHAWERGQQANLEVLRLLASLALVRIYQGQGHRDQAWSCLQQLQPLLEQGAISESVIVRVAALRARLFLAEGKLDQAQRSLRESGFSPDTSWENERYFVYVTHVRILIAAGRHDSAANTLVQAQEWLERIRLHAEQTGFTGRLIETLMLKALAWQAQGHLHEALHDLHQAVSLAEPEGYVRLFADEGEQMARLLLRLQKQRYSNTGYIQALLTACLESQGEPEVPAHAPSQETLLKRLPTLVDPLSVRELEVLRLLAAGASNQDIATRLVITVHTVKEHVKHILAKLAVTNRTQAVTRARELHFL